MNMTDEHPHRREILAAITAGTLAIFGGCYLITDGDGDVGGDREENETNETVNETDGDTNETNLTTEPDLNTSYPDDDC